MDPAQLEAKEPSVSQQKSRSTSTRRISGKQLKESKVEDKIVAEEKNVNDEFKPKIKHLWEDHRLISSYDSQFFRLMKEYYGNIVSEQLTTLQTIKTYYEEQGSKINRKIASDKA